MRPLHSAGGAGCKVVYTRKDFINVKRFFFFFNLSETPRMEIDKQAFNGSDRTVCAVQLVTHNDSAQRPINNLDLQASNLTA